MNFKNYIIIFISATLFSSCIIQMKVDVEKNDRTAKNKAKIVIKNTKLKTYNGWWIYGEGQHLFKDEQTLDEYNLEFPHENMKELVALYLAVCEMEYLPMECSMTGELKTNIVVKKNTLIVSEFEILYIQGCGE